ncbi:MAG: 4-amino-4-deoxy-L-arabinose transferase [Nocardioidaceae bacterium]
MNALHRHAGPTEDTAQLVTRALPRRPALLASTRLVAVDGPAGSGKTTLAADLELAQRARGGTVETLHMDDLYEGWTGLDTALERRVLEQILRPLATGAVARWQRYDWHAAQFDGWVDLAPPDVLVLEGCGSGARTYAPYTSLLVWLDADRQTRIQRGLARDGAAVLPHWLAWMDLESAYFTANDTAARADIPVRTD